MDIQRATWNSRVPLEIRLNPSESRSYDSTDPYLINVPRVSYLPFLLPRLYAFFKSSLVEGEPGADAWSSGWFSVEGVPLRWHWPVGVLYDLFRSEEDEDDEAPATWVVEVHFRDWPDDKLVRLDAEGKVIHDAYINAVKEADFLRNGTAKGIMTLSKEDSTRLWRSVQDHDFDTFNSLHTKLLSPPGSTLRHVPLRVYLPTSQDEGAAGVRLVQTPLTPTQGNVPHTLGTALNTLLPSLFPSKRTPTLAKPVLHGAQLPLSTPLEEVMRLATYADGWLHLVLVMLG